MARTRPVEGIRRPETVRHAYGSRLVGKADPRKRLTVYLHLRNPERQQPPDASAADLAEIELYKSRASLARRRSREYRDASGVIRQFARDNDLLVRRIDLTRRFIALAGTPASLGTAFGTVLTTRRVGGQEFFGRTGRLTIPRSIAPWTRAVLGLDDRPLPVLEPFAGAGDGPGLWPSEVARLYGFPDGIDATGRCVGILALGGGYLKSDLERACSEMGVPVPEIAERSIEGATNQELTGSIYDEELALDLQVVAGIARGARIVIYFAPNKVDRIPVAISEAALDSANMPDVLSISWGSPERFWPPDVIETARAVLRDATRAHVAVVAAAGDALATCGLTDEAAHVCFPASSPYVLGCGGTQMQLTDGQLSSESVWNESPLGTGGGISALFVDVPEYQLKVTLPTSANGGGVGRGVPDVAAGAGSSPGYRIVLGGETLAKSGTSAVAPLWAAVIAGMGRSRGQRIGMVHPLLYTDRTLFRDVTVGDNKVNAIGYGAGPGWNACTGLGSPQGMKITSTLFS